MTESDLPHLHPTDDHLLVHLRPGQQETAGGLIIPPAYQQITQHADVLAVGPKVVHCSQGQLVLLNLHCGTHICWKQNTPVLMVRESDVQAILEDAL